MVRATSAVEKCVRWTMSREADWRVELKTHITARDHQLEMRYFAEAAGDFYNEKHIWLIGLSNYWKYKPTESTAVNLNFQ